MSKVRRSDKYSVAKPPPVIEKERSRRSDRHPIKALLEKAPKPARKPEKLPASATPQQPESLPIENSAAPPEKPSKANNFQTLDSHIRHYIQCFESKMVKKMYESENRLKQHMDSLIENAVKNIIENQEECRVMCVQPTASVSAPPPRKKTRFDVEPQAEPYNWPTGEHPIENPAWPEGQLRVFSTHPQRFLMRGDPTTPFEVEPGKPKVNCIFCKLPHFSDCCPIIPDPLARREILKDENRCMKCCGKLEGNHQCNTKPCRYCKAIGDLKSDHHSSICRVPKNIE